MTGTENCPRCESDLSSGAIGCPSCGIRLRILDSSKRIL